MSVRISETSAPADQPQGSVARGLVAHPVRWLTWGTVMVVLCTVAVVGGFRMTGTDMSTVGQASPVAVTVNYSGEDGVASAGVASPVATTLTEDDPRWNSCTLGNRFPCDETAILPGGRTLRVDVIASAEVNARPVCAVTTDRAPVVVRVSVMFDGSEEFRVEGDDCAARRDPRGSVQVTVESLSLVAAKSLDR